MRGRSRYPILIVVATVVAYVAGQGLLGLFVVQPPTIGWVALVIDAAAVTAVVAVLFTGVVSRARATVGRRRRRNRTDHRSRTIGRKAAT